LPFVGLLEDAIRSDVEGAIGNSERISMIGLTVLAQNRGITNTRTKLLTSIVLSIHECMRTRDRNYGKTKPVAWKTT